MKKYFIISIFMLALVGSIAMGQIKPIKKGQKPKTEQTQKQKTKSQSKTSKKTSQKKQLPNRSVSHTSKEYIIQHVVDDMVFVSGGSFFIDSRHQITVSGFYISKYEVTQELWVAVMGSNPSRHQGNMQRPVEQVSWDDCQLFISRLNKLTGKDFRLPTEAEWQYAARGGKKSNGYLYSGSNIIDDVAWFDDNSTPLGTKMFGTKVVGTKNPNELGIYDMSGNVYEWCQDWYSDNQEDGINPTGPSSGKERVLRGGSWNWEKRLCEVSCRQKSPPSWAYDSYGLRLVLPLESDF